MKVDDWHNEPSSVIRFYFVFIEQFKDIKAKGMRDLVGVKNGFMQGCLVS